MKNDTPKPIAILLAAAEIFFLLVAGYLIVAGFGMGITLPGLVSPTETFDLRGMVSIVAGILLFVPFSHRRKIFIRR